MTSEAIVRSTSARTSDSSERSTRARSASAAAARIELLARGVEEARSERQEQPRAAVGGGRPTEAEDDLPARPARSPPPGPGRCRRSMAASASRSPRPGRATAPTPRPARRRPGRRRAGSARRWVAAAGRARARAASASRRWPRSASMRALAAVRQRGEPDLVRRPRRGASRPPGRGRPPRSRASP